VADVGAGTVRAVTIGPAGQVTGSLAGGQPFTTTIPVALGGNNLASDLAAHHVQVSATISMPSPLLSVLLSLLPLLLIGGLLLMFARTARRHGGGLGGLGEAATIRKAKARVIDDDRPATRFADVAGYPAVKTEVMEIVEYLRDPARYHRAGARGPRGVLMAWPPGTGKTLLARAVAGEAHVPFLSVSGSSFVEISSADDGARCRRRQTGTYESRSAGRDRRGALSATVRLERRRSEKAHARLPDDAEWPRLRHGIASPSHGRGSVARRGSASTALPTRP
jgi:cell division protease FtsH